MSRKQLTKDYLLLILFTKRFNTVNSQKKLSSKPMITVHRSKALSGHICIPGDKSISHRALCDIDLSPGIQICPDSALDLCTVIIGLELNFF